MDKRLYNIHEYLNKHTKQILLMHCRPYSEMELCECSCGAIVLLELGAKRHIAKGNLDFWIDQGDTGLRNVGWQPMIPFKDLRKKLCKARELYEH